MMRAMQLRRIVDLDEVPEPLVAINLPLPEPAAGDLLIAVAACAVCHTELDEIEGRTPPPRLPVIPGHQVVGRVARTGAA
jgi:propanol-preferring alcohol dehydrogenase